jgi:transposase
MRALEPEVVDAIFAAIEPLLPEPPEHPLGCHRPRISDRLCFWGILIRLTTGSSWVDIEAILEHRVSDTTLRARRDEWIAAGVFDQLRAEAVAAFDRIIGSTSPKWRSTAALHKAPYGGEGTGKSPVDRGKLGWKWSVGVDRHGIPFGWAIDGANRNDVRLLGPPSTRSPPTAGPTRSRPCTSTAATTTPRSAANSSTPGLDDHVIQRRRQPGDHRPKTITLGLRWIVEAANSGCRTTGSSAATPTARTATATPRSASPPPCSSSANSSPTATATAR